MKRKRRRKKGVRKTSKGREGEKRGRAKVVKEIKEET